MGSPDFDDHFGWYTSSMIRRWLMFGLALMMLTLCLAAWGVSYWREIDAFHNGKTFLYLVLNLGLSWGSRVPTAPEWYSVNAEAGSWDGVDKYSTFSLLGFSYGVDVRVSYFTVPLWSPSLLSLSFLWFNWRKTRRKPAGKAFPIEPAIEATSPSA